MILISDITFSSLIYGKYGQRLIFQASAAFLTLIILLSFKNKYVFTEKRTAFFSAIMYGLPLLLLSILTFFLNINEFKLNANVISLLLFCAFGGIFEELLCRAWLQNEFLERFSHNKKQIILSIILSSLIFSLMHVASNLAFGETVFKIINTLIFGSLLGVIYYKTKNIWTVIFLHSFYNFTVLLKDVNIIKECIPTKTLPTSILIYTAIVALATSLIWIVWTIILLKTCKFNKKEVESADKNPFKELRLTEKKTGILSIALVVATLVIGLFPKPNNYNNYYTCFKYDKKELSSFIEHYPYTSNYDINIISNDSSYEFKLYYDEEVGLKLKNVVSAYEVKLMDNKDFVHIDEYIAIEEEDKYIVLIYDNINKTTYYSDYIVKSTVSNENQYVDNFLKSFKKIDLPEVGTLGYLTIPNDDYKYPFIVSDVYDNFIIDKEGKIYIIEYKENI